ncbi:MAG: hypothetical protein A2Y78_15110 [Acidobacteria bacterium RBG_13_68_16]|jgi:hypothetical protein|nr:MAG: hypothetical protein A2Y78_15110 [Acidobacteria bacterium RBG_13_68_16]
MRRLTLLLATVGVLAVAAVLGWRWWTAPPREDSNVLAAALASTPADADGAVTLAQPARAARWLASHPQAAILLKLAAPAADRSLTRFRGFLLALASEARGPLSLWWRGAELAAGAEAEPRAASALQRLAALEGLPFDVYPAVGDAVTVRVGSAIELLGRGENDSVPGTERGRLAALARCGERWWRIQAGRSTLELVAGDPPNAPEPMSGGLVTTSDLAALVAAVEPAAWVPSVPACLIVDGGGWGVALPATALPRDVRRLLTLGGDVAAEAPPGARHWRGLLGDLWVRPEPGLAVASRPDLLDRLPREAITGESGVVRGVDLAHLLRRVAEVADGVPGGARYSAGLRRAAPVLEALRLVRWRLLPQGGRIELEW